MSFYLIFVTIPPLFTNDSWYFWLRSLNSSPPPFSLINVFIWTEQHSFNYSTVPLFLSFTHLQFTCRVRVRIVSEPGKPRASREAWLGRATAWKADRIKYKNIPKIKSNTGIASMAISSCKLSRVSWIIQTREKKKIFIRPIPWPTDVATDHNYIACGWWAMWPTQVTEKTPFFFPFSIYPKCFKTKLSKIILLFCETC